METEQIVNILNETDNESSIFATRKLNVINDQNNIEQGEGNENYSSIKSETKVIKSSLWNYSDDIYSYNIYIFIITTKNGDKSTKVTFKN